DHVMVVEREQKGMAGIGLIAVAPIGLLVAQQLATVFDDDFAPRLRLQSKHAATMDRRLADTETTLHDGLVIRGLHDAPSSDKCKAPPTASPRQPQASPSCAARRRDVVGNAG